MTPAEFNPMDPALEQAVSEIRNETPPPEMIEAAAARVWARLAAEVPAGGHIGGCAEFQALIPDLRAGRLIPARATLLKDHLHECVACRKVYEGKVTTMPSSRAQRASHTGRWIMAAAGIAAGFAIFIAVDQYGPHTGHAIVQLVNGTLYEVSAAGIRPLALNAELADNVEFRTAANSDAVLQLRDGSLVELRERSGISTMQAGSDMTIRLARGSVIVQAAKRRNGHLYVATSDCRVAVTGTVFSVTSGVKGSRVSVIQGEVHVAQDNREKILHPGEQAVTSDTVEPVSVQDDISWSRNRDRLVEQLNKLRGSLQEIHLPALRYSSRLLGRLPASTVFFAGIPNLGQYLGEAQVVFRKQLADSPELRAWLASRGFDLDPLIEKLRTANEYLGDEIVIIGAAHEESGPSGPVILAEVKRGGFPEFLKSIAPGFTVESPSGLVVFGPVANSVRWVAASVDSPNGFQTTPFYGRIAQAYREGAGMLLAADLASLSNEHAGGAPNHAAGTSARYFVAEEKEIDGHLRANASIEFNGPRTGLLATLAEPAPMGSLDYISPDATIVTAFAVKSSSAIVDSVTGLVNGLPIAGKTRSDADQAGQDVLREASASLGGEFSLSMDGPIVPVPSWKLVTEVYDPSRLQAVVQKLIVEHDQNAAQTGDKPLRTGQEVVDGRTYYMVASGIPNPLTEVHYTFADGYLIAGPSRAIVQKALQMKAAGTSIAHSSQFVSLTPRDHFTNFSALVYQNLGTSLAPIIGLLGGFLPPNSGGDAGALQAFGNLRPMMICAYGEPDRVTIAGSGDLGMGIQMLRGNLMGAIGRGTPLSQFTGTSHR